MAVKILAIHMASWTTHFIKKAKEVLTALGHNVKETVIDADYNVEAEIEKILMDGCRDLADARLVDARTLDSEKIHRRSINRWTRQALP